MHEAVPFQGRLFSCMLGAHQRVSDNAFVQVHVAAMLRNFLLAAFVLCAGTACAGTAHPGDRVDLRGTLTLRGNEPFTYPVVSDGKHMWQLVGVDHATAGRLQNRVVHVTGRVAETAGPSTLPAVQVDSVTATDEGTAR
jgi:hypothetical protein